VELFWEILKAMTESGKVYTDILWLFRLLRVIVDTFVFDNLLSLYSWVESILEALGSYDELLR
jgi:hypothetical protein